MSRCWWLVGHSGSSGGHGASVSRSRAPETAECGGYSGGGGGGGGGDQVFLSRAVNKYPLIALPTTTTSIPHPYTL